MSRRSKSEWQALFAEYEVSGLSVVAFCRERELNAQYFGKRRKQLHRDEDATTPSSFVPVAITRQREVLAIELQLSETLQLRLPTSVSPAWLAELVQQLRG